MAVDFSAARSTVDLLVGASNGDGLAIDELYRRHKTAGVGYARRRGAEDPEAIYDHVFVDVLAKADYLSTERPNGFVAYLNRSIKNRIIQESRRKRPLVTLEGDRAESLATEPGFEDLVIGSSWVNEAFAGLTDAQREVMEGRYIEHRTLADVADRLGKSPSSVRQLHQSALARLRVLLAVGVLLVLAVAAAWIVRELATRSVDTSPIDRGDEIDGVDDEGTSTDQFGSDAEQGLASIGVARLADAQIGGSPSGSELPSTEPTPVDDGPDDPAGPTSTIAPDGGVSPPSTEATDPGPSSTPTTESTPNDSSQAPTSSGPGNGYTTTPIGGVPLSPTTTTIDGPPTTDATTTTTEPPAIAPPSGGLIAHDPFLVGGFQTFGFDPDSGWTASSGQLTLTQQSAGLAYTDRRGQRLADGGGAMRVSGVSGDAELRRPLPTMPSGEYGYAVSFLIRADTPLAGQAFWTPDGSATDGAVGIQAPQQSITFLDGAASNVGIEQGETMLVVVQVIGNEANLWVNPRLDRPGQPSASHQVAITDPSHAVFGFGGASTSSYTVDEFRIGSNVADVLPYTRP